MAPSGPPLAAPICPPIWPPPVWPPDLAGFGVHPMFFFNVNFNLILCRVQSYLVCSPPNKNNIFPWRGKIPKWSWSNPVSINKLLYDSPNIVSLPTFIHATATKYLQIGSIFFFLESSKKLQLRCNKNILKMLSTNHVAKIIEWSEKRNGFLPSICSSVSFSTSNIKKEQKSRWDMTYEAHSRGWQYISGTKLCSEFFNTGGVLLLMNLPNTLVWAPWFLKIKRGINST